ncbi:MAG TPA: adenylate/guanylate cyclase domain-containing protein [Planctomycetota bacterium]|nr:adenylate/guanylate cyclase domain-containing protein [Planctomycetota bacterium]
MSAAPRFRISYRVSLMVAIPGLVVLLSGLIILQSYLTTTREVEELAHSLFRDLSRQAFHRTRDHLSAARDMVTLLQDLSDQGRLSEDRKALGGELLAALRSNADYTWVSYSDEAGAFTGAYRASDGSLLVNASWIINGKTKMEEFTISRDGVWTLARSSDDYLYDPRTRPFYTRAMQAKQPIWTPPYVFFGQEIPGITYAAPRWDRQKRGIGVFSVDFDLNRLSELMRQVSGTGSGTTFMFTPDGTLLAHPEVKCVECEGKQGRLLKLSDVSDPVLRSYAEAAKGVDMTPAPASVADQNVRRLSFNADGKHYLGAGTAYRVNDELSIIVGLAAPEALFLGPIQQNLRMALMLALAVLVVGFGIALLFANTVARPLLDIAAQMNRVAEFDLREPAAGRSIFREIDRMERSLNGMIRSLSSFAAYVPRDLVKRLVTTGEAARLEGRTKRVTILFSDVAGFTSLSERLAPNELVQKLGDYLSEMAGVIASEQGTVDKFIGDGVMAFWNAPEDQADHAVRALRAAMGCQRRLAELRARPRDADRALPTRIGLATGEVVVGNIGSPERMNYTVVGDTANLASRLEALNKAYGTSILISDETASAVQESILCRPVDVVAVVGKEQGVKVWEPLCAVDDAFAAAQMALAALTAQALQAYLARDLETASKLYRRMSEANPEDSVAAVMASRCEDLLKNGLPEDWSGVTKIRHK